ncbi:arylamine N-acetyltransferase / N-hydroxyarylamine O-acetyltransferase-like [Amblyomma americanum]
MEALSDERVEDYLRYLGVSKPTEPNRENLDVLVRAHIERATFENLDVLLERHISLDAEIVFSKVTRRGRGGYCFELNSLFGRLLLALGYRVQLRAARLRLTTPDDSPKRTRLTHMVLSVELSNGDRCFVDVGMDLVGFHRALPVQGDALPFRVIHSSEPTGSIDVAVPTSSGGWKIFYTIEPYNLDWQDFVPLNWYSSTNPDSATRRMLLVGRRSAADGSWLRLTNDRFVRWSLSDGLVEKRVMRDEDDILQLLQTEFGLRLNVADEVAPLRIRLRSLLDKLRMSENLLDHELVWPEV